jgi:predicted dehydrogenase
MMRSLPNADKPLLIAVAGAGQIGKRHIEMIATNQASKHCRLHSIIDPSPSAAQLAASLGTPFFSSIDALLGQANKPDGIVLATPNQLHVTQALQCLAHGIPTLVEKPIATTVADALSLCEAAENSHVPLLVGHHRRHSGIMAASCEVIAAGRLGKLVAIQGSFLLYKAENEGYFDPDWRKIAGGGPILLNMIHEVGNLRSLCGEISAVHAFSSNATRGFAVEDTASINIRFVNGALGSFIVSDTAASSRSWEHTTGEDPRYALSHVDDDDCYVVAGTMGSLSVPSMRLKSFARAADQSWHKALRSEIINLPAVDPMQAQMAHFCDVIRGATPLVSARDGLQNLKVVEAISESARTGRIVHTL